MYWPWDGAGEAMLGWVWDRWVREGRWMYRWKNGLDEMGWARGKWGRGGGDGIDDVPYYLFTLVFFSACYRCTLQKPLLCHLFNWLAISGPTILHRSLGRWDEEKG